MLDQVRRALSPGWLLAVGATVSAISFGLLRWKDISDYDTPHSRPWDVSTDYTYVNPIHGTSVLGRHIALIVCLGAVAALLLAIAAMSARRFRLPLRASALVLALGSPVAWIGIDAWASRRFPLPEDRDPFYDVTTGFWGFAVGCLLIAAAAVLTPVRDPRERL